MCILPHELIVYYRDGCHLCERVVASLFELQKELKYEIKPIDIDTDPELRDRYNVDVPVVTYQGEVLFYHFFDETELRKALTHG
ncbi:MAG: glutaredoxin family protein [Cocleimonas sp.]